MPTVLIEGPYQFIFFSSDWGELAHIHMKHDKNIAKYWLEPVSLVKNIGFKTHELTRIENLVRKHHRTLLEAWNDYFGA